MLNVEHCTKLTHMARYSHVLPSVALSSLELAIPCFGFTFTFNSIDDMHVVIKHCSDMHSKIDTCTCTHSTYMYIQQRRVVNHGGGGGNGS